jgi:hypothetical protein
MHLVVAASVFFTGRRNTSRVAVKPCVNTLRTFCTLVLEAAIFLWRQGWQISVTAIANVGVSSTKTTLEMVFVLAVAIGKTQIVGSLSPYAVAIRNCEFVNNAQSSSRAGAAGLRE